MTFKSVGNVAAMVCGEPEITLAEYFKKTATVLSAEDPGAPKILIDMSVMRAQEEGTSPEQELVGVCDDFMAALEGKSRKGGVTFRRGDIEHCETIARRLLAGMHQRP